LNLKIATNLNKLDVYATSDFKILQKMQWIGLLKQEEREREREREAKSKQMKQIHDIFSHSQPWPTSPNLTH